MKYKYFVHTRIGLIERVSVEEYKKGKENKEPLMFAFAYSNGNGPGEKGWSKAEYPFAYATVQKYFRPIDRIAAKVLAEDGYDPSYFVKVDPTYLLKLNN